MVPEKLFYRCSICGNIIAMLYDGGGELVCCGQPMEALKANTTDAAQEKHVPAVTREGNRLHVQIGSTIHPMTPEHFIMWISVVQENMRQLVPLQPGPEQIADFTINDGPATVYEYCNIHGLWKNELA